VPDREKLNGILAQGKLREQKLRDIEKLRRLHPDASPEVIESMLEEQKKRPNLMPMLGNMLGMRPALMGPRPGGPGPPIMGMPPQTPLALQDASVAPTPPPPGGTVTSYLNSLGYPLRPGTMACTYFAKMGSCKYASQCKWDHPEKFCGIAAQKRALMASRVGMILPSPGAGGMMPRPPQLALGNELPGMGIPNPTASLAPSLGMMGVRPLGVPSAEHLPSVPPPLGVPNTPIAQSEAPPSQTTLL